jgi:hypothetical protein
MQHEDISQQLLKWMEEFIEHPHPSLGNWPPCPYARQARLSNNIVIRPGTDPYHDGRDLALTYNWDKEVVVFWYNHILNPVEEFVLKVQKLNKEIMPMNVVALEDHPAAEEYVAGIKMNFGKCALLVVQQLSKLNNAANQLRSKGYYNQWSVESLNEVVTWRYHEVR